MGFREIFQKAAVTGFHIAGNLVEKAEYKKITDNGFGENRETVQTVDFLRSSIETALKGSGNSMQTFLGEEIFFTDVIGKIAALSCRYPIEEHAVITLLEGDFLLKKKSLDPAQAIYTVLLRRI